MDTVTPTIQYQAQSIIYRTPNLRYFIGASKQLGAKNDRTLIPPDFVLSWCPKLEYYVGDGSYNNGEDFIRDAFTQSSTLLSSAATTTNSHSNNNNNSDNQQRAFQYFCVGNVCDTGQIISVLRKYKDTLKHLKIAQSSDRRHIFQAIPMQQLCTLYCNNINYSMKSIVTLLNSCRNTIQEVQLQHDTEPHILDLLTLQSLQKLPQLRALTIKRVAFTDENSVVTLLTQLPLLENLILEEEKLVTLPEEAAPLSENLRRLTPVETHIISNEDESLLEGPNFFAPLAQCGPNLESVTLKCHGDIGIQFTMLDALAALPSLKSLHVEFIGNYQNQGFHEEKEEQQMLKFLNSFLHRCDNDMNNNITTITSPPKIEKMTLYGVSKLTYNILNILGDFTNLQDFTVLLSGPFPGNRERVVSSDSPLCNVDLSGVWELLRKSKKLKRILFMRMILLGEGIPSIYLTKKLAEQQQDDFQLRKYVVKPGNNQPLFRGKMVIQQIVKIINMDYQ
ncbi:hypothetical protein INT45_012472 [Circinella minor]|uniref:Uncharacterized protein n=1 Tax=Circinella minor TaxID=1195481 RepID=A0A8H7S261_9FUNG|nr:hypothetical protein INT45_012472 [Circinella minor]